MTIADKLKQIKQSTDAIKASATALTGEVQTDLTSIAIILDTANPANATDILNMLGYTSTNAPDLYNAFLNSLNKEEGASYNNDTTVLLPKLTLDENGVYNVDYRMFKNSTILTVPKGKYYSTSVNTGFSEMFNGCGGLLWVPDMELDNYSQTYSCNKMFQSCSSLRTVGNLNMKGCTDAFYMFQGCVNLESIKSLDTSDVVDMGHMFDFCITLKSIPQLDTSNVTDMQGMFNGCSVLESIPQLNTSKVKDMSYIFKGCSALTSVPQFDYSSVTNLSNGFSYTGLTTVPDLNLESATNLQYLFQYDSDLVTVGNLNTPKLTSIGYMFEKCDNLEKIASIDVQSVTNTYSMFGWYDAKALKYVVFKNLGQSSANSWNFTSLIHWGVNDDTYTDAKQSLIDTLITYSYDRASAGMSACTITLSAETKAQLTDDEITQIATKGYTIA